MYGYLLVSKNNKTKGRNLRNSFQKEQRHQLLPPLRTLDRNIKDIRKSVDNSTKEILVHTYAENNNPQKSIERSTCIDNGDKIIFELFGSEKNAKIMALAQLVGDAHKGLQIAFAEDLYLYCQANNIDFTKLRAALNTKWNVNVPDLEGGISHSIKRDDSKMLMSYSSKLNGSKIINAIFNVDHEYRKSKKITDEYPLKSYGKG